MKTLIALFSFALFVSNIYSQPGTGTVADTVKADTVRVDTVWRKGGIISLAFNQVSLSNWAAGGENSMSGNALLLLYANMKKNDWAWDNTLDLALGATKLGDRHWRKADDKIDLNSKAGYNFTGNLYLTYLFGFKTQFTEGFIYYGDTSRVRISNFLTPAYILNSIGVDWKPSDKLSIFLSPITAKTTIVNDELLIQQSEESGISLFGVEPGKKVRTEIGAYFQGKYQEKIMENIILQTKLELFSSYTHEPQNIDVNWEVVLSMKVNKYINALLTTQLLYDNDVFIPKIDSNQKGGAGTQFKETFGIGFAYKFDGYAIR